MIRRLIITEKHITFAVVGESNRFGAHLHFTPNWQQRDRCSGGIEFHTKSHSSDCDNEHCWLLGSPCQHDGSSLYAQEKLVPMFFLLCEEGDYEPLWRLIEEFAQHNAKGLIG